jgi:hypothetical protein
MGYPQTRASAWEISRKSHKGAINACSWSKAKGKDEKGMV